MVTTSTRIELPSPMRPDSGGALAIAERGPDKIVRVAVATEAGVARAEVRGATATASTVAGDIAPRGRHVLFRRDGDQLHLMSLDGADVVVPSNVLRAADDERASWELVSLQSAVVQTAGWPVLHFVKDGTTLWSAGTGADGSPYVAGYAVSADKKSVYVAMTPSDRSSGIVSAMSLDGKELWRRELPVRAGRIVASSDSDEIAVLTAAPSRCEACIDATILDARSGATRRVLPMATGAAPLSLEGDDSRILETAGFVRGLLWLHAWRRERHDDMGAGRIPEHCWYSVYDTKRSGEALVSRDTLPCSVRSVIPLDGGDVLAIDVVDDKTITANVYDGPP